MDEINRRHGRHKSLAQKIYDRDELLQKAKAILDSYTILQLRKFLANRGPKKRNILIGSSTTELQAQAEQQPEPPAPTPEDDGVAVFLNEEGPLGQPEEPEQATPGPELSMEPAPSKREKFHKCRVMEHAFKNMRSKNNNDNIC